MEWTKQEADALYHISKWGEGYFDINEDGFLTINPSQNKDAAIVIKHVIDEMRSQDIQLPAVIRFHDILENRVKTLNTVFKDIISDAKYKGRYYGVYPIKVNQMREVVEEIVDAGKEYDFGLEAGSKPELISALAYNNNEHSLTICNGHKDDDFIRLALLGNMMGMKFIIVVERFEDLNRILKLSKDMNVKPIIGLRAKMSIKGWGRWASSIGETAKFGLSTMEILNSIKLLEQHDLKNSVRLLHFHLGSQVSNIRIFKNAISESGRIYALLVKMGLDIEYFDVGGGLGVDYDGSRSIQESSINYTIEEYASDIIWGLKQICDLESVPHPHIITESGRYITAHHSCVITNVIDTLHPSQATYNTKKEESEHHLVEDIRELGDILNDENYQEVYNDANQIKDEALSAFKLGILNLDERAKIETLYWKVSLKIRNILEDKDFIPEELKNLKKHLSPQYLCNFSVFQSAADTWAIKQVLPIVPLARLNERPAVQCTIADITCDSDGKIDQFILQNGERNLLSLHEIRPGQEYLIGLFLTGAYQDVMGDMHNLFGRLNEVHVYSDPDDSQNFYLEEIIKGHKASTVLSTMQYNTRYMAEKIKKLLQRQVGKGKIAPRAGVRLADFYEDCLNSYTYLNGTTSLYEDI